MPNHNHGKTILLIFRKAKGAWVVFIMIIVIELNEVVSYEIGFAKVRTTENGNKINLIV